eukprot:1193195-Prorocentrum_minimum.AAC.7
MALNTTRVWAKHLMDNDDPCEISESFDSFVPFEASQNRFGLFRNDSIADGIIPCQLLNKYCPKVVHMHRLKSDARSESDFISNYKVLQEALRYMKVTKVNSPVDWMPHFNDPIWGTTSRRCHGLLRSTSRRTYGSGEPIRKALAH